MDIPQRAPNDSKRLNLAEMIQMATMYMEKVNGKPKYKVTELCDMFGISRPTFHRYLRYLRKNV